MKRALITGVTGQDGAYLAEFLLLKGYEVFGTYRRSSTTNFWRLNELNIKDHPNLRLLEYDLTDLSANIRILESSKPDEVYNLAAQSFVGISFDQPVATAKITGLGVLNLLEAIRIVNPRVRFYQASSSEMFGKVQEIPQTENTPFYPRSPYGVAKLYGHWITINYRESYDIFASSGILFNHESPLRGMQFVTRKITDGVAKIQNGQLSHIELGNLNAKRDWGFAKDYVEGMYLMLQAEKPCSYILATNTTMSVREFVTHAFQAVNIDIQWEGKGIDEVGVDRSSGKILVKVDPHYFRAAEVDLLIGDPEKAKKELGWTPKTSSMELCKMMVEADVARNQGKVFSGAS